MPTRSASTLFLAWFALFICVDRPTDGDDQAVPRDVWEAFLKFREGVSFLQCEMTVQTRICQGSMTEAARRQFKAATVPELPAIDQVISLDKRFLIDFAGNRYLSEGYDHKVSLDNDGDDGPRFTLYKQWAKSSFDGVVLSSITPRNTLHAAAVPAGITHPVEFWQVKPEDGGDSIEFDSGVYPLLFLAGGVTARGFTAKSIRGDGDFTSWRLSSAIGDSGIRKLTLVSLPLSQGQYCEMTVDSSLGYRVVRFGSNNGKRKTLEMDIRYDAALETPRLASWTVKTFRKDGNLAMQHDYEVKTIDINPGISSGVFTLTPQSGMVVESREGHNLTFRVEGQRLEAGTNYALNEMLASRSKRLYVYVGIAAAVLLLVPVAVRYLFTRFRLKGV